jgi:hypothetical protein
MPKRPGNLVRFLPGSCWLAALLLPARCPQQKNSKEAAIQQEALKKNMDDEGGRGNKKTLNKNTRATGKTLKNDFKSNPYLPDGFCFQSLPKNPPVRNPAKAEILWLPCPGTPWPPAPSAAYQGILSIRKSFNECFTA